MEQVKFSDEEISQIRGMREDYNKKIIEFGQLRINLIDLESKIEELKGIENGLINDLNLLREFEKNISKKLSEKYGAGSLNLETGIFEKQISQ